MKPLLALALLLTTLPAHTQTGILLPRDKDQPDAAVLSLEEMSVTITIDDSDARVSITQIFSNHTRQIQEGAYIFALPSGSTVSDFATWDGPVRIPAVILERKRAEEIYAQARAQAIDPGLLEAGERAGSDPAADSAFTAKISPIPAYGTKRLEIEYHQRLPVDRLVQGFLLPLKPTEYTLQTAAHLHLRFELHSTQPINRFTQTGKLFPLHITQQDDHTLLGTFDGANTPLSEDLATTWHLDPRTANTLTVTTFRDPHPSLPSPDEVSPPPAQPEPGFFLAQTLLAEQSPPPASTATNTPAPTAAAPRNVVLLLDTSLSMQWDKLERSFAALQATLLGLAPTDTFSLILFNQDVFAFKPQPTPATPDAIQQALQFVRSSRLSGGTDLGKALTSALAQASAPNSSLYLFTDGNSDRGATILTPKLAANYTQQWQKSPAHPRTNIFAVGDDANLPLLRLFAANDGVLTTVLSTEPVDAKLSTFLSHSTSQPVPGLHLDIAPTAAIHTLYPLDDTVYPGSIAAWVGDYKLGDYLTPTKRLTFTAHAATEPKPLNASAHLDLPEESLDHPQLPRLWAQARVNALLAQVAADGETRAAIDEIIALSRRYKFVTPYTSFLAVPRALLRPRIIRPGDPVLRIHTDPAITSVIAIFPFGLTKPLRHLVSEDTQKSRDPDRLWETRFLAPTDMQDGAYTVRLILRDAHGNTYAEQKTFVIASTPPSVRIHLDRTRFHRGDLMLIRAGATASTRTLTARLQSGGPTAGAYETADLRWNPSAAFSTGQLRIPGTLAPGTYTLSVTAEDIAHNVGSQEVQIDVIP
jgi:Ca-activated chloride channel homolog